MLGLAVAAASGANAGPGARQTYGAISAPANPVLLRGADYARVAASTATLQVTLSATKTKGLPSVLTPGYHTFVLHLAGRSERDFDALRFLDPAYTQKQLKSDLNKIFGPHFDPKAYHRIVTRIVDEGGIATHPGPAIGNRLTLKLVPGTYFFKNSPDSGNGARVITKVTVAGSPTGTKPKATATITQHEFSFGLLGLRAGSQIVRLANTGAQIHELVIVQILDPSKTEQDAVNALLSAGQNGTPPAWIAFSGFGGIHTPKDTEYLTLHLSPGRYLFACFMPDATTGQPHVLKGMHRILTIG